MFNYILIWYHDLVKIKIIGRLYLVGSLLFIASSAYLSYAAYSQIGFYMDPTGAIQSNIYEPLIKSFYLGAGGCVLGLVALIWSIALIRHKKWSWYFGVVFISLLLVGNIFFIATAFSVTYLIAIAFNTFALYSLFSEKMLFARL